MARLSEAQRDYFRRYLQYIENTGGKPTVEQFDDDWEPIGPMLRAQLMNLDWIIQLEGSVSLLPAGRAALEEHND